MKIKTAIKGLAGIVGSGFQLPKIETKLTRMTPSCEELVEKRYIGGSCTIDIPYSSNTSELYRFRWKSYSSPSGKHLFNESAGPGERCYYIMPPSYRRPCNGPRIKKLAVAHRKISGRLFWMPLSIYTTHIAIPKDVWISAGTNKFSDAPMVTQKRRICFPYRLE